MLNDPFLNLRKQYPDLTRQALEFFGSDRLMDETGALVVKSFGQFTTHIGAPVEGTGHEHLPALQQFIDRLVLMGRLTVVSAGRSSFNGRYVSAALPPTISENARTLFYRLTTCAVFGFPFIYDELGKSVLPLVHHRDGEDVQIGTIFISDNRLYVYGSTLYRESQFDLNSRCSFFYSKHCKVLRS